MTGKQTALTEKLNLRYPIVQGPFGGGLSTVKLVTAVSEAGGLGSFGAHHLSPEEICETAKEIRRATTKPFALNLWVSDHDEGGLQMSAAQFAQGLADFRPFFDALEIEPPSAPAERVTWSFEEQVEAVMDAAPPVFSFVFGILSREILESCRRRRIVTIGSVTTVDEAIAMDEAGVDILVASGCEAGGHRPSFLNTAQASLQGTFSLVPQVVDAVSKPIIAAGGISDARGMAAAFALGAAGVLLGTAFLACEESGASALHRAQLFSSRARTTTLSRAFSGRLARFIKNDFLEAFEKSKTNPLPFPLQNWFSAFIKKEALKQKNPELMALYSGQGAPLLRYKRAAEVIDSLVRYEPER